jgi:hypothetical protein
MEHEREKILKKFMKEVQALAATYEMNTYAECLYCGRRELGDGCESILVTFIKKSDDNLTR